MPHELPKAYDPSAIEQRWAEYWVREKLFHVETPVPHPISPKAGEIRVGHPFTLLLPPPNVTGRLHMGHMLNHTEMDILVRWHRMRGQRTLWLPGTDHAGIATQMMVERQLASEGVARRDLGREKFVERVWEWKKHYGGAILAQMKRLGDSVDWGREYFTMDDNLSRCVREVFVRLYEEGLIYRGNYIVNWCPRCITAISDLEVVHEDFPGKLYQVKYPVVGSPGEFITVATTRPETILGDTAVAVNAADERYRHLHGKKVVVPLMNREVPIILDGLANPEFGTGAVKVTPAHDPNDYQAGLRHNLPQITVMDETACMNQNAGPYAGLDRFEAREKVLHDLEKQGLLAGTKDYVVPLGKCDRCKTIVEPRLSTQWFIAVNKQPTTGGMSMAGAAAEVVRNGTIRFTPENYKTIFLQWMDNIHDWCISRQLWWGHRIPAWHCAACQEITVARETPAKCAKCGSAKLEQDPDVLDTWFSSGLLPFTTLGWPEPTRDLEVFYPTSLLVTAYEILFFWVARMIMFGCHFMMPPHKPKGSGLRSQESGREEQLAASVPFREVYIHALVRDAERQKMSKTKGNVIDPIEITEKFGTDAVRFTLASMASPGTDIAYNPARTEGYRAFANKIWNAARLMFMNVDKAEQLEVWSLQEFRSAAEHSFADDLQQNLTHLTSSGGWASIDLSAIPVGTKIDRGAPFEDRWITSRLATVSSQVEGALSEYRFDDAASTIYHFFWGEFCDWYLEIIKPRLTSERDVAREALVQLVTIFERSLRLLSPFMPFITEELWHAVFDGKPPYRSIALAPYPAATLEYVDLQTETDMAVLQDLIVAVRNIRAELKVDPKLRLPIEVFAPEREIAKAVPEELKAEVKRSTRTRDLFQANHAVIERLANADLTLVERAPSPGPDVRHTFRFDVRAIYKKQFDEAVRRSERERLEKELARIEKEIGNAQRQLANEQFLAKAPAHVVEGIKKRAAELDVLRQKAQGALAELQ